jgi:hypothetical protein
MIIEANTTLVEVHGLLKRYEKKLEELEKEEKTVVNLVAIDLIKEFIGKLGVIK